MQILHHFLAMMQQTVNTTSHPSFGNIATKLFEKGLMSFIYGNVLINITIGY